MALDGIENAAFNSSFNADGLERVSPRVVRLNVGIGDHGSGELLETVLQGLPTPVDVLSLLDGEEQTAGAAALHKRREALFDQMSMDGHRSRFFRFHGARRWRDLNDPVAFLLPDVLLSQLGDLAYGRTVTASVAATDSVKRRLLDEAEPTP